MKCVRACAIVSCCLILSGPAAAQSRSETTQGGGVGQEEAAALARGWTLLSQRSFVLAAQQAQEILRRHPRSVSALTLAVEVAVAQGGAIAGLDAYEHWLGSRNLEEPGVLRRIARGVLTEAAGKPGTRLSALRGLASEGDEDASGELAALARQGSAAETRALAAMGDQSAAAALTRQLSEPAVDPVSTINALGESGYAAAIGVITTRLADVRPEVRGAAAEAVGKLGAASAGDVAAALAPLLDDPSSYVRTRAAGALYCLGDQRGTPWLLELARSESPAGRLVAAEAMACRPDAVWTSLVTGLVTPGTDPEIRLGAAKLLATVDPAAARSVAEAFSGSDNAALRELAAGLVVDTASGDGLATLRGLLRAGDDRTRLAAATRIVALTR